MISPDERREVAREMRDITDTELYVMYLDEILCGILGDRWCRDGDFQISSKLVLLRLADLIDPTCEREDEDTDEDSQYRGTSLCSECGELLISQFIYCPHCGARVTRGGEG